MKKFIPFLSIAVCSVCLLNCSNRDENMDSHERLPDNVQKTWIMREDSAASSEQTIDPTPIDPPVRDGDNWRLYQKK